MSGNNSQPAGNTTSTTTTNTAPWSVQQPYLASSFQNAANLGNHGLLAPAYYPGQTLASTSPYTNQGIDALAGTAGQTGQIQGAASNLTTNTLNGNYLNSNPYLDQTYNHAADQLQGQMRSAFGGSDVNPNTNSSLQASMSNGLADLGNQIYGNNYQAERQRQDQALALAPGTQQAASIGASNLLNAGQTQQGVNQQIINDQVNRFNYNQNLPMQAAQNYRSLIDGNYGMSSTTLGQQPYYMPSTASNIFGGALGGLALNNMYQGQNPGGLLGNLSNIF